MGKPNLAEAAFDAVRRLTMDLAVLLEADSMAAGVTYQSAIRTLAVLELTAKAHATVEAYDAHRRKAEGLSPLLPLPEPRHEA